MSYTAPEDAQRPRVLYDIHPDVFNELNLFLRRFSNRVF